MKVLSKLFPLVALAGCAAINPLNSETHVQSLFSSFSNACQKVGGAMGTPTLQGSEGVCTTKAGMPVNMYINSAFILLQADAPPTNASWGKFLRECGKIGGELGNSIVARGGKLDGVSGGKEKCSKKGVWNATQQFTTDGGKEYSRVFYSFPRDSQGDVKADNWDLVFKLI